MWIVERASSLKTPKIHTYDLLTLTQYLLVLSFPLTLFASPLHLSQNDSGFVGCTPCVLKAQYVFFWRFSSTRFRSNCLKKSLLLSAHILSLQNTPLFRDLIQCDIYRNAFVPARSWLLLHHGQSEKAIVFWLFRFYYYCHACSHSFVRFSLSIPLSLSVCCFAIAISTDCPTFDSIFEQWHILSITIY